jgi:hypothetical protein
MWSHAYNVIFFNFGASSLKTTLAKFTRTDLKGKKPIEEVFKCLS